MDRGAYTEEPGGLQSIGSQRVKHDLACTCTRSEKSGFMQKQLLWENLQGKETGCVSPRLLPHQWGGGSLVTPSFLLTPRSRISPRHSCQGHRSCHRVRERWVSIPPFHPPNPSITSDSDQAGAGLTGQGEGLSVHVSHHRTTLELAPRSVSSLHLPRIPVPVPWLSGLSRVGDGVCFKEEVGWAHPSGRSSSQPPPQGSAQEPLLLLAS